MQTRNKTGTSNGNVHGEVKPAQNIKEAASAMSKSIMQMKAEAPANLVSSHEFVRYTEQMQREMAVLRAFIRTMLQ